MSKKENVSCRSSSYQFILLESAYSNEMMEAFSNDESIYSRLNPFEYNEELLDLEDQLKVEFWRVVKTLLTPRQCKVVELYNDGYTQMEIGKLLGINQSSITKNFFGSQSYTHINKNEDKKSKSKKIKYGGTVKKLKKIVEADKKIQDILEKMSEIRSLKW